MNPNYPPPPYPGPMAPYPAPMAAPLYRAPYPGVYQQPVYQQYPGPAYGYGPGQTVYVVEERRTQDSALTGCLQGCLAALCCCCMCDMLTACN
ncbi:cysteine-rich and transmembrane domain-containing protein 1-like [Anolis carolinensis]|uniref:cysteine-rich and transmembrane domain-containing protein 1-like n=1 Tax=Anolis carolinensis TaxID=28377 RepID=UPI0004627D9F|nr:PREDICTED: cysteine-rich and transmembrane domain-containing protein 1-like [Anolis carolinensis]|eukprot:XP_008120789.1 PREDICTED: cysteine-rich and transmembrane domain-containing protein 1-like [Anolis carolinensis]